MKNSHILILHSSNDLYGASKILLNVIDFLIKEGKNLHLILPYEGPLDNLSSKGVKISHYNLGVLRKKYYNFLGIFNRIVKVLNASFFISNYIKKNNIDLIYTNTSVIVSGAIAANMNKLPCFFHIHEIPTSKIYFKIIGVFINLFGTKIVVVSNAVKKHWAKHINSKRLNRIYNGISIANNRISSKFRSSKIIFGIMARIIPYKGHEYFIDLANEMLKVNKDFEFVVYGDIFIGYENYLAKLKKKILDNGLEDKIFFKGFREDVNKNFSEINFLIHCPVKPDPLPTVILEAMNLGIPIIASDLGGITELLNFGKGGLLIPFDNIELASKKIIEFTSNRLQIENKIINSSKYLKNHFSIDIFEENIKNLFQ